MTALFDRLFEPVGLDTFLSEHYQTGWLHLEGCPERLAELTDLDDIERVLTSLGLHAPDVALVNASAGGPIPADQWTYPSGLVDVASVAGLYADGATVVLNQLHRVHERMAALVRAVEATLQLRAQTNVYLTPPGACGLGTHYDTHDVLALQILGSKRWTLYQRAIDTPLSDQPFEADPDARFESSATVATHPGDVLYLPSGLLHDAAGGMDGPSLHITVGLLPYTVMDLLATALRVLSEDDVCLRRALRPGWMDDLGALPDVSGTLMRLTAGPVLTEAQDRLAEDLVTTRHGLLPGQLRQVRAEIGPDSLAQARPHLLVRTRRDGDQLRIDVHGRRLTMPARTAAAAATALGGQPFRAGSLPGLDVEDSLALTVRLLREGLVTVAAPTVTA